MFGYDRSSWLLSKHNGISIIQECYRLRNFSSMDAIAKALQSPSIQEMALTQKERNAKSKKLLKKSAKVLEPDKYREALDLSNDRCIPCLGNLSSLIGGQTDLSDSISCPSSRFGQRYERQP